jgi:CRP-like cAMP-binding protein
MTQKLKTPIAQKSKWMVVGGTARKVLRVVFTFYYLISISFRLAFRCHIEFKNEFWDTLIVDYLVDFFFWCNVICSYFDKVSKRGKIVPVRRAFSTMGSDLSGLEIPSRMNSMNNMTETSKSPSISKQQVAPEGETSSSSSPSRGAKLLKSLSSFSDYDIFGTSEKEDGGESFSESDLLSNFRKNEEDHEMSILIKQSSTIDKSHYTHDIFEFLMLCPFEIFGFFAGYQHYYLLRSFRLLRVFNIPSYFSEITRILVDTGLMVGASARRVLYLTIFMILFAHVGACCFYALGLYLVENGTTDVWLTADGILTFREDTDDGSFDFNKPLGYRYVRVLYWAIVTSQTVGFGDVSPRSIEETSFCLVFFYCSHFLCAQLAIGNLLLLFDVYDSARTQYKERIEQLEKYAQFRKLPTDLKDRITYFYYHQWKVLKGLDESHLLEELPNNIKIKVKQATVRDYLLRIPMLKRLKMVVMNALAEDVKLIIFSPSDVIVPIESMSTGMYIISRGEAFISSIESSISSRKPVNDTLRNRIQGISEEYTDDNDDNGDSIIGKLKEKEKERQGKKDVVLTQSLKQGDYFGAQGLSRKYEHTRSLNAGTTVCEVLFLSRVRFQRTIGLLLSEEDAKQYFQPDNLNRKNSIDSHVHSDIGKKRKQSADEKERRIVGYQKTLSHIRASAVLNLETTTTSSFVLRLKADGDIRTAWDVLIFLGIAFYSISIPFNLSYTFKDHLLAHHIVMFSFGYLVDILFFIDLLSRMFLFPAYSKSVLMTSSMHIFAVYRQQFPLWIELLSVIPFDFIAVVDGLNLLPILRLFKIYHLSKFKSYGHNAEKTITKYFNYSLSFSTSRFISLQIGLFELCHWAACMWQLVADFSTHMLNYDINWKQQDRDSEILSIKYSDSMDNFPAYIRSLYWAINALSTSGVADMPSSNLAEMLFVCFALLLGCQLINAVLGSIASMMGNINKHKSDFSNKMDVISKYMKFKRLPVRLQLKIQFFFEYNFQRTSGVDEMKLLADLPQPLREDVVSFVVGSVVIGIPFFHHCNEPMLEMILGLLTRRCFLNNDDVVIAGEFGKEFFIIESGIILVTSKDKQTVYANLKHGNYIGESCLLKVVERTASAHARDYSETYVLKKTDFENVVDVFPEDGEIVKTKINDLLNARSLENKKVEGKKCRRSMIATFVRMESIHSLDTTDLTLWNTFLEEFSYIHKLWECLLLFILLYNLFMIPLRLAFTKDSFASYYVIDYSFDIVLWVDMYLNANKFRRIIGGKKVNIQHDIWRNYKVSGELKYDLLARFPYDLLALAFIGDTLPFTPWFVLAFLRLPKMFLLFKGAVFMSAAEYVIEKAKISFFALRMLQVLVSCLMVGHFLGCGLYILQTAHYGESCVNEEGEFYGDACKYRDTWIEFLIYTGKLPSDGGSAFSRYVACINWAIPTMVLYTVGDVYPMNINETAYIFAAMFIGIPINAMIVGTIIALVTQVDDHSADILMKSDTLRENLIENNADDVLIEKVSDYIKFLVSDEGKLLGKEEEIFEELPHTLQVMLSSHLKEKFFHNCPFFDHIPEEVIRNLCMTMQQQIYNTGDYLITHGDIGHEMFFIESGDCEVISWDKRTVLAKLQAGAFMGETSFFGLSDHGDIYMNLENVRASSICVCYVLKKRHFDHELLPFSDGIDAEKRKNNLSFLRDSHCKRHAATLKNLKMMENTRSILSKILGPMKVKVNRNVWLEFISPTSNFLLLVDVIGYLCMLYYAFVIPFEITFLHGDISDYFFFLKLDFCIDALCVVELVLRLFVFPLAKEDSKSYEIKSSELYRTNVNKIIDICASLPIELFVLLPSVPIENIFFLRLIHLLRLSRLFIRTKRMEEHMLRIGITIHFTTLAVVRGILVYLLGNHWMACLCFSIHRYLERNVQNTWVVVDGYATFDEETQKHDICGVQILQCYQRSIYFVGTVLTSVGYGDVSPITTGEMIFQIVLAIVGACMGANICGQLSSYLKLGDRTGEMAFKEKLKSVEHYCSYRNLKIDLRLSLIANYHIMWDKERRVGTKKSSFLHALSTGMMGDVALALNKRIIDVVPLFQACRTSLHSRLAYALKPQITLPDTSIYTVGDSGSSFFLILSGQVNVTTTRKDTKLDDLTLACLSILEDKHAYLKNIHESGHHFGEYALSSKLGIRRDRAVATQLTETYALNKDDLWRTVFQRMPTPEQYLFVKSIFSTVGGHMFIADDKCMTIGVKHITNRYFRSLIQLVTVVVEDITGTGRRSEPTSPRETSGCVTPVETMFGSDEGKEGGEAPVDQDPKKNDALLLGTTTMELMNFDSCKSIIDL